MAVTPTEENETFYREVDEELRREQMSNFFRRYGAAIIIAVVVFLVAVAAFLWWRHHKEVVADRHAETLTGVFQDIQAGKKDNVDARLNTLIEEGSDGYRAAALLTKADMAIEADKPADAIAALKKIAGDEDIAEPYRNLALIRQTALEFDSLPPATVIARLKPLAVAGNPWFGSAGEMVAIAYLKENKPNLAGPIFQALAKDERVPPSIRSRAVQMAGSLGIDAVPELKTGGDMAATGDVTQ